MATTRKPAQLQPFALAGSGSTIGDTSFTLQSFKTIDGVDLVMADLGTKAFGTLEPGSSTQEEQISFTGLTINLDGTTTLTGVNNVAFLSPYTETSGLQKIHAGGVRFVISNTSGFYSDFVNEENDATITGLWVFDTTPEITNAPVNPVDAANKDYVDNVAIAGAPDASEVTKGIVQIATNAQMGLGTSTGTTGARLIPPNDQLVATSAGAGSQNKLATLNASGQFDTSFLSVTAISKGGTGQTTQTNAFDALSPTTTKGDLIVNNGSDNVRQGVGTNNFVLMADSGQTTGIKWATTVGIIARKFGVTLGNGTTSQSIAHGLGTTPQWTQIYAQSNASFVAGATPLQSTGIYDGSTQTCLYIGNNGGGTIVSSSNATMIAKLILGSLITGSITVDATNINITWNNSSNSDMMLMWQVYS